MFPFWPGYLVFFVFSIFVTFIFPPFYEQMLRLNMCCSERDVDSPASETELFSPYINDFLKVPQQSSLGVVWIENPTLWTILWSM